MRKLIILIAVFALASVNMTQAQTKRPVQRRAASTRAVAKAASPQTTVRNPSDDKELRSQRNKLDSLEALRDDLQGRAESHEQNTQTQTDYEGTEYQVARAVLDENELTITLRLRNKDKSVTPRLDTLKEFGVNRWALKLDNGFTDKTHGKDYDYVEKGYWREIVLAIIYNVDVSPIPKFIEYLEVVNGSMPEHKMTFKNIPIIDID